MTFRVLLVDDHQMFRDGLRAFLERDSRMVIVAAVGSIEEAESHLRRAEDGHRPLDFMLLDVALGSTNSIVEIPRLRNVAPRTDILMLSMHGSASLVRAALDAGAKGFVSKASAGPEIIEAMDVIRSGATFIDSSLRGIVSRVEEAERRQTSAMERYGRLSSREQQIFRQLACGNRPRQIAVRLGIAKRTADAHRYHIMQKLEVENVAELVRLAVELGIVDSQRVD